MKHPLDDFRFCPRCGAADFSVHDARSKRCHACGFTYYHTASAATVAVILNRRRELLVTRRAFEPARGTLDLPGGFVDPHESLEEGCRREAAEETGAEVTACRYLFSLPNTYRYSDFDVHTADAFFVCELADEDAVSAADDAAELHWMPLEAVRPEDFGLASVRQGVRLLLRRLSDDRL